MTDEDIYRAMARYKEQFGDDALPGLDYIPEQYRSSEAYFALLERCVAENRPMEQLIELIDYPTDVLI